MQTILDILHKAGGWHPALYLKIDHEPYMELVIEAMDESGPCGLPALSVCHYGEQNGEAMRDPEMLFELGLAGSAHLTPFYWRNDYVAVEQWSRFIRDSDYHVHSQLFMQHVDFAKTWDRNLRSQGFAEAFDPANIYAANPSRPMERRCRAALRHHAAQPQENHRAKQQRVPIHRHRHHPRVSHQPPPHLR